MKKRVMMLAMVFGLSCNATSLKAGESAGSVLQSSMIWAPSATSGQQAYVAFRKSFDLPEVNQAALLDLFADSRYMLWVNGKYVLRGPCRFNPKRPEYDSVDVGSFLQKGSNTLVVLVHNYAGAINGRIMGHAPGLTARLGISGREVLRTDSSWRCSRNTEYRPSPGAWSSIPDVIDARLTQGDWVATGFDDSAWETAVTVDGGTWGTFQPRGIPLPRETVLTGLRLLPSEEELSSKLPLEFDAGKEAIIDLGRMAMAYAMVDLEADEGSVLQIRYALRYENGKPGEMYGVGTTYTARGGRQSFMAGDQWCSHYMTVKCVSGRMKLHGLRMVDRRYPFERLGSFRCSDELLSRLWELSVYTIETVTDDGYGSDARERNEWLQDPAEPNFITTRVAESAPGVNGRPCYSDPRLLKNLLRHSALSQLPDGRILATFPTDRGPSDCHYVIEDYSCQWIEALKLYFDATGDKEFVREMWPALAGQMKWFLGHMTPRGLLLAREYTSFDNPLAYVTCEGATMNAFFYQALKDAAYLGVAGGEQVQASSYADEAEALGKAYNRQFWNEADSAYNSAFIGQKVMGPTSHAQLMALDRGIVPENRKAGARKWFLANYRNPGSFHCCSNPDFEKMVAERAGLNMPVTYYWVFQEFYRMNLPEMDLEAIREMRRRWGVVVEKSRSTGTVSEGFGAHESCHNYGAVPAYFLSSYVLGVRLDGPASKKHILVEPRLGDLAFAEGVVVTEHGPVAVSWKNGGDGGMLAFEIEIPGGVDATVHLPRLPGMASLVINGNTLVKQGEVQGGARFEGRWIVVDKVSGDCAGKLF